MDARLPCCVETPASTSHHAVGACNAVAGEAGGSMQVSRFPSAASCLAAAVQVWQP